MRAIPAILVPLLFTSCTGSSTPQAADPTAVARAFFEAVAAGDAAGIDAFLSEKARAGMHADQGGFSLENESFESITLGTAEIEGERASVPVRIVADGSEQALSLEMRHEAGAWAVTGFAIDLGGTRWAIDLESDTPFGGEAALQAVGEEFAQQLADGMQDAFADAMSDWQNGGSADEIAVERAQYDALSSLDAKAHDTAWTIRVDANGRAAREVLAEILEGQGLPLDAGGFEERLGDPSELALEGVSRLAALDALCAEVGLRPVFPASPGWGGSWSDELPALRFEETGSGRASTTTGPFRLEVVELQENAPHTTGALTLEVRALGLAPAVLAANREMSEFLRLEEVLAADGSELLADPDARYLTTPVLEHGMLVERTTFELKGLLSGVRSCSLRGSVALELPAEVTELSFDPLAPGRASSGDWTVAVGSVGTQTDLTIERAGGVPDSLRVGFAPDDETGAPLGMLFHTASAWSGRANASFQCPSAPARLGLKVCRTVRVEYPFRIDGMPLLQAARQPAELSKLSFEGERPVEVRFLALADEDPAFPKARFRVESHANKDALEIQVDLEYLGADGKTLEQNSQTLNGEPTFEGPSILVGAGGGTEQETTVFFMPEGTKTIRALVRAVEFVDGTRWESD